MPLRTCVIVISESASLIHENGLQMPYSGADVLAHLSELARQRAELPRITSLIIIASHRPSGELIQSALRAVVGYDTKIFVAANVHQAVTHAAELQPEMTFYVDESPLRTDAFTAVLQALRKGGLVSPITVVRSELTSLIRSRLLELGAIDVVHRDEVCGLRLRESLLKLPS